MKQSLHFNRLLSGSAIYGLGGMANRLVVLLLLPVLTAYLTPADYGVVAMLVAFGGFITPVFTLGFGSSIGIVYFNVRESDERRSIMWSAGAVLLVSALILALLGWILRVPLSRIVLADGSYGVHTAVAFATTALGVLAMPWQLKLQFEERSTVFVMISLTGLVTTMGASLWFVVGLEQGAIGALAGGLVGQALGTLLAFAAAAGRPSISAMGRWIRELLRHGLPMIPGFFFVFLLQQWVRWPLEWHYGLDVVGVYSVGTGIGATLGVLAGAFISAWTPFALSHAGRHAEAEQILSRVTLYYVAGFGFLTSLFFLFAEPVVQAFTQPAFHGAAQVVGLTAAAQFLSALFLMLLPPLYFARRADNVVATQAVATLVVFLLAECLVPMFGALGAAVTVVLGFLTLVVAQWVALQCMPVLRIRYDYLRIGLLFALVAGAGALSFTISFANPVWGFAIAGTVAFMMAAAIFNGVCRLQNLLREWKGLT